MKKLFVVGASFFFVFVPANSQSEKKEPPPPPPKPKQEVKYKIVKQERVKNNPPTVIEEKVNASKPLQPHVVTVKGKDADVFYKRNPTVSGISRQGSVITIKMKDGTTEKYDMRKKEDDESFAEKYEVFPIPPAPPPPKPRSKA